VTNALLPASRACIETGLPFAPAAFIFTGEGLQIRNFDEFNEDTRFMLIAFCREAAQAEQAVVALVFDAKICSDMLGAVRTANLGEALVIEVFSPNGQRMEIGMQEYIRRDSNVEWGELKWEPCPQAPAAVQ
jgi:hypothetical protein